MHRDISLSFHGVGYKDLREYLKMLEKARLLKRVDAEVDLKHEIGAICARSLDRRGPALLFDNVKDYPGMPIVSNIISTTEQLAIAFGTNADENEIYGKIVWGMENRMPSLVVPIGPCKEEIYKGDKVDLYKFPTPYWHELDGGQYIGTTAGCVTRHPETGIYNMGTYRCMVKDKKTLSLAGGTRGGRVESGGDHVLMNDARGLATPIAVVLGMDPLLTLASGTSVPPDEKGYGEYEAAGAWRRKPTELVRCETSDLLISAHAEVVIEGEVMPGVRTTEGPHGESTGFYGENKAAFVVQVNCITQRKNPIIYGLICRLIEDYPRSLLRSGSLQSLIIKKSRLKSIRQVYFPEVGRYGMLVVSADIRDADEPRRVMNAVWEHTEFRWVIVVDEDCDVRNWNDVIWRVCSASAPGRDIVTGKEHLRTDRDQTEMELDPPSCGMGIDATMRCKETKFPPINQVSKELVSKVAARWKEYGLP